MSFQLQFGEAIERPHLIPLKIVIIGVYLHGKLGRWNTNSLTQLRRRWAETIRAYLPQSNLNQE